MPAEMVTLGTELVCAGRCEETHIAVRSLRLPTAFDGLTAIQLTDLHFSKAGRFLPPLLDYVARQEPDLWLLTGDLLENIDGLPHAGTLVQALRARLGVWFVPGNNDNTVFRRDPASRDDLYSLGLNPLVQTAHALEQDGEALWLVGVDDPSRWLADLPNALSGVPPGAFTLLLAHCVDILPRAAEVGVDVVVCGHSHGGQICLPWFGPIISGARMAGGRHMAHGAHQAGATWAYVCRGIGTSVLPFRLWCRREIARYTFEVGET